MFKENREAFKKIEGKANIIAQKVIKNIDKRCKKSAKKGDYFATIMKIDKPGKDNVNWKAQKRAMEIVLNYCNKNRKDIKVEKKDILDNDWGLTLASYEIIAHWDKNKAYTSLFIFA